MATGRIETGDVIGKLLQKSVAGSDDVTLTDAEAQSEVIELTGALTGDIDVFVPFKKGKVFTVVNLTTGNQALTVKAVGDSGSGIAIAGNNAKKAARLYMTDGPKVQRLGADVVVTS